MRLKNVQIMRVLVTGINGQLGHDVAEILKIKGFEVTGTGTTDKYSGIARLNPYPDEYLRMDITDADDVRNIFMKVQPDVVVHCAGWTAVDKAEDMENRDAVYRVNVDGTRYIADMCSRVDAKLIFISTDYVFDGHGSKPWKPDSKEFAPLNYYGFTKLKGEEAVSSLLKRFFVLRISWVYGINGSNFVRTMLKLAKSHDTLRVVDDQIGSPGYTRDIADLIADMCESDRYGFYHAANSGGYISWYDFACEIFRQAGNNVKVVPVSTEQYGMSAALRPSNSRLDMSKLEENGFNLLPDWKDALTRYLKEVKDNGTD